jgi:hypothetical protein
MKPAALITSVLLLALAFGLHGLPRMFLAAQAATVELDQAKRAEAFIDLLDQGDFDQAVRMFGATMRAALPAAKLREVWQALPGQLGPLKQRGATRSETVGGMDLVTIPLAFENFSLDARIAFAEDGLMTGFRLVPAQSPPAAAPEPASERDLRIGDGAQSLAARLRVPQGNGPFPVVLLVHGSGPHDMDQTIGPHRIFHWLAEALAERGVASLRYEKRTKAYPEAFADGRYTVDDETVNDAVQAIQQLGTIADIDSQRIFVAGHSLGGLMAPRIAQRAPQVAGLILMAAPARPLQELVLEQFDHIASLRESPSAELNVQIEAAKRAAAQLAELPADTDPATPLMLGLPAGYWRDLNAYDPLATAMALPQRMLIMQGGRDYQVSAERDFGVWQRRFEGSPRVSFKIYPEMNHIFLTGEGPSGPEEYFQPGQFMPEAAEDIATWIRGSQR